MSMETRANRWGEAGPTAMQAPVWPDGPEQVEPQAFAEQEANLGHAGVLLAQIVQPLLAENARLIDLVQNLHAELEALREQLRQFEPAAIRDGR